jgi:aldehyde dehydrogenase (NAD+)
MSSYFTDLAQQYIDGEWRPGTGSWDIIDFNPYDGEKLASITIATVDEVDQAYRAAARAQKEWAATNPYARRAVFEKALRIIEEREQEIAEVIIAELGGTHLKAGFELHLVKEFLRESVNLALRPEGRIIPSPVDGKENRLYLVPVGVVGVISPFNFPFLLSLKSVAPALALGNGVVLKPHQNTPIVGGSLVAKIFEDAGLPAGLLNVVITDIAEIGDAFIEHPSRRSSPSPAPTRSAATSPRSAPRTSSAPSSNSAATARWWSWTTRTSTTPWTPRSSAGTCIRARSAWPPTASWWTARSRPSSPRSSSPRSRPSRSATRATRQTVIGPVINSSQADAVSGVVDQAIAEGATALVHGTSPTTWSSRPS